MAGRGRPKSSLILTSEERNTLQHWARRRTIGALALRSRMVLASADGHANNMVAEQFGVSPQTAGKWRARFIGRRLDGLNDEPRSGAPPKVTDDIAAQVVAMTLDGSPPNAAWWSTRSLARTTNPAPFKSGHPCASLKPRAVQSDCPMPGIQKRRRSGAGLFRSRWSYSKLTNSARRGQGRTKTTPSMAAGNSELPALACTRLSSPFQVACASQKYGYMPGLSKV